MGLESSPGGDEARKGRRNHGTGGAAVEGPSGVDGPSHQPPLAPICTSNLHGERVQAWGRGLPGPEQRRCDGIPSTSPSKADAEIAKVSSSKNLFDTPPHPRPRQPSPRPALRGNHHNVRPPHSGALTGVRGARWGLSETREGGEEGE